MPDIEQLLPNDYTQYTKQNIKQHLVSSEGVDKLYTQYNCEMPVVQNINQIRLGSSKRLGSHTILHKSVKWQAFGLTQQTAHVWSMLAALGLCQNASYT